MPRHPRGYELGRRDLLLGAAALALLAAAPARAVSITGALPWRPNAAAPPEIVRPGPWRYLTAEEGAALEAIVDRLIPPDPQWAGGKDAGCAVFIDRQLAGPYGRAQGLYMSPPFMPGTPTQGLQSPHTPAALYRLGLAALDRHCRESFADRGFAALDAGQQDKLLHGLESGSVALDGVDGKSFFGQLLANTIQGFFADPVHGGNRNMVGWRMIGFPGARYDYRDWVERHNEPYPLPPVSIGLPVEAQP